MRERVDLLLPHRKCGTQQPPPKAQCGGSLTHVRLVSRFQALEWFDGKQLVAPCKSYLWCSDEPKVSWIADGEGHAGTARRPAARPGCVLLLTVTAARPRPSTASPRSPACHALHHQECSALLH